MEVTEQDKCGIKQDTNKLREHNSHNVTNRDNHNKKGGGGGGRQRDRSQLRWFMAMIDHGKRVKSIIMHQIKNEMDYQACAGGQGSEVKFNINTETIMASAWMSLEEINKELM